MQNEQSKVIVSRPQAAPKPPAAGAAPKKAPARRRESAAATAKRAAAEAAAAAEEARAEQLKRALTLVMRLEQALAQCYSHQVRAQTVAVLLSCTHAYTE